MKNRKKMVLKSMRFFDIDFLAFFCDFGAILGNLEGYPAGLKFKTLALGPSKNSPGSV